jgi:uncharacterized protein YaiL (DUF2058 family)
VSESLRDQLLKSGLAKQLKAQAPPAPQAKPRQNFKSGPPRQQPHGASASGRPAPKPVQRAAQQAPGAAQEPNLAHAYALRAKQEKDDRARAQREVERNAQLKRERKQRLADLLGGKGLNASDAETPRHFPHGNKIRRVYCTPAQLVELNRGELAVVQLAGRYLLVTKEVALEAQAIDEQALVLLCDPNAPTEDDVPADLVW